MNDDYEFQTRIEDHKEAIEFYKDLLDMLDNVDTIVSEFKLYIMDRNDLPDVMRESDAIAKACCEYLIEYAKNLSQDYDGRLREEQNALMELES